jgi:hypothetical protein
MVAKPFVREDLRYVQRHLICLYNPACLAEQPIHGIRTPPLATTDREDRYQRVSDR